jgi:polyisoprenoid-binding protein YceI
MKKLSLNIIFLSFFLPVVLTSWQKSHEKDEEGNKIKVVRTLTGLDSKTAITRWNADAANAQINFVVGGPFGKVHGKLGGLKSAIQFDENNLTASSF